MARGDDDVRRDDAPARDELPGIVASPDRVRAWLAVAKTGDEFVYATRCYLPAGSAGAATMRELAGEGLVHLKQRAIAGRAERNYVAERTSAPLLVGEADAGAAPRRRTGLIDDEARLIDRIYPVLASFARFNRPCPTDAQIAARVQAPKDAIKPALEAMETYGLIRVQGAKAPTLRMVTIVATGHRTGMVA